MTWTRGQWVVAAAMLIGCSSSNNITGGLPVGGRSTTVVASGSSGSNNGFGNSSGNQYYFSPSPDTVASGATVTFKFLDVAHTVTFDQAPASVVNISLTSAADSTRTFAMAGTYTWHCSIHPYMHGTLVVQ